MVDLDDAKYDRTVKTALLQRRRKRILSKRRNAGPLPQRMGRVTRWCCCRSSSWLLVWVVVLVSVSVVLVHRRRQSNQRRLRRERLERAEALWQQRLAPELEERLAFKNDPNRPHHHPPITTTQQKSSNNTYYQDDLMDQFARLRQQRDQPGMYPKIRSLLESWLDYEDLSIRKNAPQPHPRWIRPHLLPPIFGTPEFRQGNAADDGQPKQQRPRPRAGRIRRSVLDHKGESEFFKVSRASQPKGEYDMVWQQEYRQLLQQYGSEAALPGPPVDYTDTDTRHYVYPDLVVGTVEDDSSYPPLQPLGALLQAWPQDEDYDSSSSPIRETLYHFNYSDPAQRARAVLFRQAELPFKVYDIPELQSVSEKWSRDDYVERMFGERYPSKSAENGAPRAKYPSESVPMASGTAQESPNNYFAFYVANAWDLHDMGLPPTRNNDWSYRQWSRHARYADAVNLTADRPHFYWQSGVPPEERYQDPSHWTFISRDLPSFSSRKPNFFVFSPDEQKGIQCRFGERGVVAATHFDGGRNMVAMIRGAKRYILSPPNQCSKLGIFTQKQSPIYRHSLLNFGHIQYLHQNNASGGMSPEERAWLERAATAQSVETVLKQGEVLYIPSHWFHYIISLQKSAQCNVRSGTDKEGNPRFGGRRQVEECID